MAKKERFSQKKAPHFQNQMEEKTPWSRKWTRPAKNTKKNTTIQEQP